MKRNNLFSINTPSSKGNALIVGNAYGIMPYVKPLAKELSKRHFQPFWFPFSGQEGMTGKYSFKQGVKDIEDIISLIKEQNNAPIHIIAHCAGSLITLEYLKEKKDTPIDKFIIYGLLYNMNRRRPIAQRKLIQSGINYDLSEEDWMYNPLNVIKHVNKDILFCHSNDDLNLDRASKEEMDAVIKIKNTNKIKWFEEGYDNDSDNIKYFIDTYVSYLNN
jgi:hypothetical protein